MPTLSLPDGSSVTWGIEQAAPVVAPEPLAVAGPSDDPTLQSDGQNESINPSPTVTEADVSAALARVPPKWTATFWRFAKTLGAGLAAAFVVAGGSVEAIAKDPTAFLTAVGAAVVMAVQKFLSWKE